MTEAMAFRDIRFTAATDKDREALRQVAEAVAEAISTTTKE